MYSQPGPAGRKLHGLYCSASFQLHLSTFRSTVLYSCLVHLQGKSTAFTGLPLINSPLPLSECTPSWLSWEGYPLPSLAHRMYFGLINLLSLIQNVLSWEGTPKPSLLDIEYGKGGNVPQKSVDTVPISIFFSYHCDNSSRERS